MLTGLGVMVVVGVLVGWQRHLIYFPGPAMPPPPDGIVAVSTTTTDGVNLTAWLSRVSPEAPLLMVFHGNGGTPADRLPLAEALRPHGISVLLVGYRGYGGNTGKPSEEGLARDAKAWQAWTVANHEGPVAYLGESLGAGVATRLALAHPPSALVLRSPFTSLAAIGREHYPLLPVDRLLRDRYEVAVQISQVAAPSLVVAGTGDRIVPLSQSRTVFEEATEPKQWLEITGAGHNDRTLLDGEEFITAVAGMLTAR